MPRTRTPKPLAPCPFCQQPGEFIGHIDEHGHGNPDIGWCGCVPCGFLLRGNAAPQKRRIAERKWNTWPTPIRHAIAASERGAHAVGHAADNILRYQSAEHMAAVRGRVEMRAIGEMLRPFVGQGL